MQNCGHKPQFFLACSNKCTYIHYSFALLSYQVFYLASLYGSYKFAKENQCYAAS